MATQNIHEALKEETIEITDKFLLATTIEDGYTGTYKGNHPYRVVSNEGEYAIYPVYLTADGHLTNEKYPIIQTDGDVVFYTILSTIDPYNFTCFDSKKANGLKKEQQVLLAFEAFIHDEFRLGSYNLFISDEPKITDHESDFEFTTKFERELVHPKAGQFSAPAEPLDPVYAKLADDVEEEEEKLN